MDIGYILLFIAFLSTIYSTAVYYLGIKEKKVSYLKNGEKALYISTASVFTASAVLVYYFITDNFRIEYVAYHSNMALPLLYKISAFWAGSEGSLLLWTVLILCYAVAYLRLEKKDLLSAYTMLIVNLVTLFFLSLLVSIQNPFEDLGFMPSDGAGLNPLLQTPEMIAHPPTLFLGYAGSALVYALAFSGVLTANDTWVFRGRKWIVFSWIWLTQGIFWGAYWAYDVLGWGGYWAWDPVENSSLLPWLTLSALMHSVMIQEAKRGMKLWNIILAFMTFEFVILGTYITRSGVISSVHAFGQSNLTPPFTFLLFAVFAITLYVIYERKDYIKSKDVIESTASKEATFLFNNLILVASALTVFWGTIFPLISEGITGYKVTIGPPFYNTVITPLAFLLIILLGLCIAFPWRRASTKELLDRLKFPIIALTAGIIYSIIAGHRFEMAVAISSFLFALSTHIQQYLRDTSSFREQYGNLSVIKIVLRKRRRYGGYTAHLGLLIVFIGIAGGIYAQEHENVLVELNQPAKFGEYTLIYRGLDFNDDALKTTWSARIEIWKNGRLIGETNPSIAQYKSGNGEQIRIVGIHTEFPEDLYIILNGIDGHSAMLTVKIEPTVNLIWLGCWILTAGGVFALIPRSLVSGLFESQKKKLEVTA